MKLGLERASKVYGLLVAFPYIWVVACVLLNLMPVTMLLVFLSLPVGVKAVKGVWENYDDIPGLIPSLGANVLWILSVQVFLPY